MVAASIKIFSLPRLLLQCAGMLLGVLAFSLPVQAQENLEPSAQLPQIFLSVREAYVREGDQAHLEVRAENLQPGERLDVQLTVGAEHADDVSLEINTLSLTAGASSQTVHVLALADGTAELREIVSITATGMAGDTVLSSTAGVTIPRHGYAKITLQAEMREDELWEGETGHIDVSGGNLQEGERLRVYIHTLFPRDSSEVSFEPPEVYLTASTPNQTVLVHALPDGHSEWRESILIVVAASPRMIRQLSFDIPGHKQVRLNVRRHKWVSLTDVALLEGHRISLRVSAAQLSAGQRLRVSLQGGGAHAEDLRFSPNPVILTTSTPSRSVWVEGYSDGLVERHERIQIQATAPEASLEKTVDIHIPRHGYAVQSMRVVPSRIRPGVSVPLELEIVLNAPAPEPFRPGTSYEQLRVSYRLYHRGTPIWQDPLYSGWAVAGPVASRTFRIPLPIQDHVQSPGEYSVVTRNKFTFRWAEYDDQMILDLKRTAYLSVDAGWKMSFLSRERFSEGEVATLQLEPSSLPGDERLELSFTVDAEHASDVALEPSTLTLTAAVSSQTVRVRVLEDGVAEPRETVQITASDVTDGTVVRNTAVVVIPRHGYAVSELKVAREWRSGVRLPVGVRLNAVAPVTATVQVRVRELDSDALQYWELQFAAGAQRGNVFLDLPVGRYEVSVQESRFVSAEVGDQEELGLQATPVVVEVLSAEVQPPNDLDRSQPSLHLDLFDGWCGSQEVVVKSREGYKECLAVYATNLGIDQVWEVFISSDHPDDLVFSVSTVTLTATHSYAAVLVYVRADGVPELEEQIRLTVRAKEAGMIVSTASLMFSVEGVSWTAHIPEWRGAPGYVPAHWIYYEGGKAYLRLRAWGLMRGEKLTAHISVDSEHQQDVRLSTTVVTLARGGLSWSVREEIEIFVLRDGEIEPTETIIFNVHIEGFGTTTTHLTVLGMRLRPGSGWTYKIREGGRFYLYVGARVGGRYLWPEESLDVRITMDTAHAGDLRLSRDRVTLGYMDRQIEVEAVPDGVPEPQEEIVLTISAVDPTLGIDAAKVVIEIPAHSYPAMLNMRLLPQEILLEGEGAELQLEALDLLDDEDLYLSLTMDAEHADDVSLERTRLTMSGRFLYWQRTRVRVQVLEDGVAEPREIVQITVPEDTIKYIGVYGETRNTVIKSRRSTAVVVIPRHGYVLSELEVVREWRSGSPLLVGVRLNEVAPVTATVQVQVRDLDNDTLQHWELQVVTGAQRGNVSLNLSAGRYEISVQEARFVSAGVGDQEELELQAAPAVVEVAAEVEVVIPRHGYAVSELEVVWELRRGSLLPVDVRLNAVAPVTATVQVQVREMDSGALQHWELQIAAGAQRGSISLDLPAGRYEISVQEARFVSAGVGDQEELELQAAPVVVRIVDERALQLRALPGLVAEGEMGELELQGLNLLSNERLEVSLGVASGQEGDVRLDAERLELTARTPTVRVGWSAVSDGQAEPRESVIFRAVSAEAGSTEVKVVIPRNGYAVSEFGIVREFPNGNLFLMGVQSSLVAPGIVQSTWRVASGGLSDGEAETGEIIWRREWFSESEVARELQSGVRLPVGVRLNAVAPVTATVQVRVREMDSDALQHWELQVSAGAQMGSVSLELFAGRYEVSVQEARFVSAGLGDQEELELQAVPVVVRIVDEKALRLRALPGLVAEGGVGELELQGLNLLNDERLEVSLGVASGQEGDVILDVESVELTARTPTVRVGWSAVSDGQAEPRESVIFRAEAAEAGSAEVEVVIPRHGYALSELEVAGEWRSGALLPVGVRLNAVAPVTATVQVRMREMGSDASQHWKLQIAAGVRWGSVSVSLDDFAAGLYEMSVQEARFVSAGLGDQEELELQAAPVVVRIVGEKALQLSALRGSVAEGEISELELQGLNLLSDERLEVSLGVASGQEGDVRLDAERVELTARTPTVRVGWSAVSDGRAEPRESVIFRAESAEAGSAEVKVVIPRHGYVLSELEVLREWRSGLPLLASVRLNAVAPVTATVQVQVREMDSDTLQHRELQIAAGAQRGSVSLDLPAGRYQVSVQEARFVSAGTGDQEELELPAVPAVVRIVGETVLQLRALPGLVAEGETGELELRGLNLLSDERLEVSLGVASGQEGDVRLDAERVELTARTPTVRVGWSAVSDGQAEPRESVIFRAEAAEVGSAEVEVVIPRNGYAVSNLDYVIETRNGGLLLVSWQVSPTAVGTTERATWQQWFEWAGLSDEEVETEIIWTLWRFSIASGWRSDEEAETGWITWEGVSESVEPFHEDVVLEEGWEYISSLEFRRGSLLPVGVRLNAVAPVTATVQVGVREMGSDALRHWEFQIAAGARWGSVSVSLNDFAAGWYEISVQEARFVSAGLGDQEELELRAVPIVAQIVDERALQLRALPGLVAEGGVGELELQGLNLLSDERLEVSLGVASGQEGDVRLDAERVELTARTPTVRVGWSAVSDGQAEPRESVIFRAEAAEVGSAEVEVVIPRHGYVLSALRVRPQEVVTRETAQVEVEVNRAVPATVTVTVQAELQGTVRWTGVLRMVAGQTTGSVEFSAQEAGVYVLTVVSAAFGSGAPGDQVDLLESAPSPAAELRVGVRQGVLATRWDTEILPEGETAFLHLQVSGLVRGEVLKLQVLGEELEFLPGLLSVSAPEWSAVVRVGASPDGQAEPREEKRIRVQVVEALVGVEIASAEVEVVIPRHGYAVSALRVRPQEVVTRETAQVEVEMNRAVPATVTLMVQAELQGDAVWTGVLRMVAGQTTGSVEFSAEEAGVYALTVVSAAFVGGEPGDQLDLLESTPSPAAELRVGVRQGVLATRWDTEILPEGETAFLHLQVSGLVRGEVLKLQVLGEELEFLPGLLSVSAPEWSAVVRVGASPDGQAEPREEKRIRVQVVEALVGVEIASAEVEVVIPRHGYALSALRVRPQEVVTRETAQVEVEVNRAVPATVTLTVQAELQGDAVWTGVLRMVAGQTTGSVEFSAEESGVYALTVVSAAFGSGAPGDQVDLLESAPSPAAELRVGVRQGVLATQWGTEILPEGETAFLHLQVSGLVRGEVLKLQVLGEELEFLPGLLSVSAPEWSAVVRVGASPDGQAEPREEKRIRVQVVEALVGVEIASAEVEVVIPRHGYAVSELEVVREWRSGVLFPVGVRLNEVAPVTATVQVRVREMDSDALRHWELQIAAGAQRGSISLDLPAGRYEISVQEARFVSTGVGDQEELELQAGPALVRIVDEKTLQLRALPGLVAEGGVGELELQGLNLLSDERLEVSLGVASGQEGGVRLDAESVELTARTPTVRVGWSAVSDGRAEPRESVMFRAESVEAGSAEVEVVIPRHGYALSALRVRPQEVVTRETVQVEVEVNRAVPATVTVMVQAELQGTVRWTGVLRMVAGQTTGSVEFSAQEAGVYALTVVSAAFVGGEPGDQLDLLESTPSPAAELRVGVRQGVLATRWDTEILPEGETAFLHLQVSGLVRGDVLKLQVLGEELEFLPGLLSVSAPEWSAVVRVGASPDGQAEPREEKRIRVQVVESLVGVEIASAEVEVVIPRHGYALSELEVAREWRSGVRLPVGVRLNEVAPVTATVQVRVREMDSDALRHWELQIAAGAQMGSVSLDLSAGRYEISVQGARFVSAGLGDQGELGLQAAPVVVRIVDEKALRLRALPGLVAEGETGELELQGLNLLSDERLEVSLGVASGQEGDVRLDAESVELTARTPTLRVGWSAVSDGRAEPRESVMFRAESAEVEVEVEVVIPRHGYALSALRVRPQEVVTRETAQVEVEVNRAVPATVTVMVQAELQGAVQWTGVLRMVAGQTTGSVEFSAEEAGVYALTVVSAVFGSGAPGDQLGLVRGGIESVEVEVRARLVRVELGLSVEELAEGSAARLWVQAPGLSGEEILGLRLGSDLMEDVQFGTSTLRLEGPRWRAETVVRAIQDGIPEPGEELRIGAELAGDAPLGVTLEWGTAVLRIPAHGYAVASLAVRPQEVQVGEEVQVELELNAVAPEAMEWSVQAIRLEEAGLDVPAAVPGAVPMGAELQAELQIATGEKKGIGRLYPRERGLYQVSAQRTDAGDVAVGSAPVMPLRVHPRQLHLQLELDRELLGQGGTATLRVSVLQVPAGEVVSLELSSTPPGHVEFDLQHLELSAKQRTATVEVSVRENVDAPVREWVRLEVRGVSSVFANWVAPAVRTGLEIVRPVPPPAPQLQGTARGPYQLWLSWTLSQGGGELLDSAAAYRLLYAESVNGACALPAEAYRSAVASALYAATPGGLRAQVSGVFADGVGVRANAKYCFMVQVQDGPHTVRTAALPLETPAYDPAVNRNADGLPDHLEALCGTACEGLSAPQEDTDGDGINNMLEAYLSTLGSGAVGAADAYRDADGDGVPDIIELQYGGRIAGRDVEVREMLCDAGAYLVRLAGCQEELQGMRLQIVMNARGQGVFQGGARGLAGADEEVDAQTRLGSGTHWLLDRAGAALKLSIRPLLSLSGSGVVMPGVAGAEGTAPAEYVAEVELLGPLPLEDEELRVRVCRIAAEPDFVLVTDLAVGLCDGDVEEQVEFRLDTELRRRELGLQWETDAAADQGKSLRLRAELVEGAGAVSAYSFAQGAKLPLLEAGLWFTGPGLAGAGARQQLVPCLVDKTGERVGSAGNDEFWHFKTEPVEGIEELQLICAVAMGHAGEPQLQRRFTDWDAPDPEGVIVLEPGNEFEGRVVRAEFYRKEDAVCGVRSGAGEEFLGEVSFLVGAADQDGNLVPDEEEGGDSGVEATGEKGLRYRPGTEAGEEEYYLRSRLSLRLGMEAAAEAMGTPNLVESGEEMIEGVPEDSLQILDGVVLDFETFCAADPGCLRAGEPVQLVFEMRSEIPVDARYYKLRETESGELLWCPMVVQYDSGLPPVSPEGCPQAEGYRGRDGVSFAPHGESGECPAPGSEAYRATGAHGAPYLDVPRTGEHCVQLTLTDNGPNDDNPLSGVVADPGGLFTKIVATPAETAPQTTPQTAAPVRSAVSAPSAAPANSAVGSDSGGGGGAMGWFVLLLAILTWFSVRGRKPGGLQPAGR